MASPARHGSSAYRARKALKPLLLGLTFSKMGVSNGVLKCNVTCPESESELEAEDNHNCPELDFRQRELLARY
jgi:hypothetical protein